MAGSVFHRRTETSVGEADTTIQVEIVRSGSTSGAVTIQYGVFGDTATAGVDYVGVTGSVVMPDGAASVFVPVDILDDALGEDTEVFTVTLISATGAELAAPRTNRISIIDDETPPPPPPVEPPLESAYDVTLTTVVSGLAQPIRVAFSPVDPDLIYVAEKAGVIRVVDSGTGPGGGSVSILLDIRAETNAFADRGLQDIALHPDFASNPYVYAFYVVDPAETAGNSGHAGRDGIGNRFSQIVRYTADAATGYRTLVPDSRVVLVGAGGQGLDDISGGGALTYTDPVNSAGIASDRVIGADDRVISGFKQDYLKVDSGSHSGGRLNFGPDGMLYVQTGDGTSYNYDDPRTVDVQSLDSLSGKVLRIDPITGQGLADNPFAGDAEDLDANRAKVFQYGLRNPFSGAFDADGRLFIADVGWFAFEEINTGGPGANFGWPYYEGADGGVLGKTPLYSGHDGSAAFYDAVAAGDVVVTPAFRAFSHGTILPGYQIQAVVGGGIIEGSSVYPASLDGHFVFADFVGGNVFTVDTDDRSVTNFLLDWPGDFGPTYFVQRADGVMYYADLTAGVVGRLGIADTAPGERASLSVAAVTANVVEGNAGTASFSFIITRGGDTASAVSVDWAVDGALGVDSQPADAGDFVGGVLPGGTVGFGAGQTKATVTVAVAGDSLGEYNERFAVTLVNPGGGAAILQANATAVIVNDDAGLAILAISGAGVSRNEGSTGGTTLFAFTVTRSGDLGVAVSADWEASGFDDAGTVPSLASDFVGGVYPTGSVSFGVGQSKAIIAVPVLADTLGELNERFAVTLSNASPGATIGAALASAVVFNDDANLSIGPAMVSKFEGDSGSVAYSFTVRRTGMIASSTVNWAVAGDTGTPAVASDFVGGVLPSGVLTFTGGQTSQAITVLVAGDTLHELDELFTVTLSGASAGTTITAATAQGTIVSEEAQVDVTEAGSRLAEGTGGTTAFQFQVTRAGAPTLTQSVDWTVAGRDGNGTVPANAADFAGGVLPSGTITFAPGEFVRMVVVQVVADGRSELNERFGLVLSNPSAGVAIGTGAAQGIILNDDTNISIAALDARRPEGGGGGTTAFTFRITRTGDLSAGGSVDWSAAGVAGQGIAQATGADFKDGVLPSGSVGFAPGEASRIVTVEIAADRRAEVNDRFAVTLSNPTGGATLATGVAQGIILDDDTIISGPGSETLTGSEDADLFLLGGGLDTVIGKAGLDAFRFLPAAIGPAASRTIFLADFSRGSGERLDLGPIDAIAATLANDAFSFIGSAAFSAAGQLRWTPAGPFRLIEGDVSGDGIADLTLVVAGTGTVDAGWFKL